MQLRDVFTVALAALLLVPTAAAYVPGNSTPAQTQGGTADRAMSDASQQNTTMTAQKTNYTRLYIEEGYRNSEVKPGESTTFNITVGNSQDETVELTPHVVLPKVEGRPIEKSWVTIENADTTLEADEERTFTVTVAVPSDAELGEYRAQIAFTNETISYGKGRPPQPVHAATISVGVFKKPTVQISSERHYYTQIKAGDSYTYEITVDNTGDQAVPLNPKLKIRDERRHYRGEERTAERSWFEIDAPNEVRPGETVTANVTVTPPESASVGDYEANVDLGLKDPARPDRDNHWQQVNLDFQIWKQPAEPFETTFQVSDETENVTLRLSAEQRPRSTTDKPATFDVTFVGPNGRTIEAQRVQVSNTGHVGLGSDERRGESQGPYTSRGGEKEFVYRITNPDGGQWTARIMPHNTTDFGYEIIRKEN